MSHPDEGTVHAYVDGALNADAARALEAHVSGCERCASAVAEARGLVAASSRILASLDAVPRGVLPPAAASPLNGAARRAPRGWWTGSYARLAAALAFVAAGALTLARVSTDRVTSGRMVAAARVAENEPVAGAPVHAPALVVPAPVAAGARGGASPAAPAAAPSQARGYQKSAARAARPMRTAAEAAALDARQAQERPAALVESGAAVTDSAAPHSQNDAVARTPALAQSASAAGAMKSLGAAKAANVVRRDAPLVVSDSVLAGGVERRIYLVRAGVRVTQEIRPPAAAGVAVADTAVPEAGANVIRWTAPDGTRRVLWGPLPAAELQRIRATLP